ncbi:probable tubulin polyglutamylase ttll-15 [Neodiprion lecontei]|uniref:Probable tubulin polyglutamylase ttll-15 n=1 Tax=Neodiprion lecontei TaxID=441921 RepID=A0A6J0BJZ9_NEOLC|nr:probable tubulin polyglutamylase ttll-15 [Neodiprion lecontei]
MTVKKRLVSATSNEDEEVFEKSGKNSDGKKNEDTAVGTTVLNTKLRTIFKLFILGIVGPVILYTLYHLSSSLQKHFAKIEVKEVLIKDRKPIYWVYGRNPDSGYLKHVFALLDRLGFERGTNESDWDLLWAHDYPFRSLYSSLNALAPHQKVNHVPGCGYITNKVDLSTSELARHLPAAFKIPEDKKALLKYVADNPAKSFVQKSNAHRGIQILNVSDIDLASEGSFVQEFIENPFLVDGFKFDIGVYTVVTSVDPLRVYVYKGDILFRFCPVKYYPFDPENIDKYVVGDDYLPIWDVPSLKNYYANLGFSMKDSFDSYVRAQGKDPQKVWDNVNDAIRDVILSKESLIKDVVKRFKNQHNFFEMMRFDFAIDDELNVFVMEANMSPNLSSAHYPPNQLLYEQVLFNLFGLVGIGQRVRKESLRIRNQKEEEMQVADKNLVVLPEVCAKCDDCFRVECQLCKPCFTDETRHILSTSYREHQNAMDFQRIFPPPITKTMVLKDYTLKNQLLVRWYQGKCELDPTWCG